MVVQNGEESHGRIPSFFLATSFCQDTFTTSEGKAAFTTLVLFPILTTKHQESYTATLRNGFHGESI